MKRKQSKIFSKEFNIRICSILSNCFVCSIQIPTLDRAHRTKFRGAMVCQHWLCASSIAWNKKPAYVAIAHSMSYFIDNTAKHRKKFAIINFFRIELLFTYRKWFADSLFPQMFGSEERGQRELDTHKLNGMLAVCRENSTMHFLFERETETECHCHRIVVRQQVGQDIKNIQFSVTSYSRLSKNVRWSDAWFLYSLVVKMLAEFEPETTTWNLDTANINFPSQFSLWRNSFRSNGNYAMGISWRIRLYLHFL